MKQKVVLFLGLVSLAALAGCGGSSAPSTNRQSLSMNWQLTLADQTDNQGNDFTGGLTGGFLIQKGTAVTGGFTYSIAPAGLPDACAGGAAPVAGTVSGQSVTLTVTAGVQTFTLTGTLSSDGNSIMGTYTTTGGAPLAAGGTCGVAQAGASWSAVAVPALTGSFQGNVHGGEVYTITANLFQAANAGASSATVTGELISLDDPCFAHASVNGTISGSNVLLSVIADNGAVIGRIGSPGGPSLQFAPAVFGPSAGGGGFVLRGTDTGGFITTSKCSAGGGNICLGTNATGCAQPIGFSVSSLVFPPQSVGTSRAETVTLTNTDPMGATQSGTLTFTPPASEFGFPPSPNFSEQDDCGTPQGPGAVAFGLSANQSCTISLTFSPQQSCTRDPATSTNSVRPLRCPSPLTTVQLSATLDQTEPDGLPTYSVDVSGTGLSAIAPTEAQFGFGAVGQGQTSSQQTITLKNTATAPVTILPAVPGMPCIRGPITVPRSSGVVPGLQIVQTSPESAGSFPDVYDCDGTDPADPSGPLGTPSFPITADNCSGITLNPGAMCSFDVSFAPQPAVANVLAFDAFVQLSTLQCTSSNPPSPPNCEIDSGRLPIEIRANNQTSLRISPNAGFDFGIPTIGSDTVQTFTILNDPSDPMAGDVNFVSISTQSATSRFSQTNTCLGSKLSSGSSCTITVIFHPTGTSLAQDVIVITPTPGVAQNISVWGRGQ